MSEMAYLEHSVRKITQDNIKKGYDEIARRPDWEKAWRGTGDPKDCAWFISFTVGDLRVRMNRTRFTALMGREFTRWLEKRQDKVLNFEIADRWSLHRDNRALKVCKDWHVAYIVLPGPEQERLGFEENRYYGSGKQQGRTLTTRAEGEWYEIDFNGLNIDRLCGLERFSSLVSVPRYANNNRISAPKFSLIPPTRERILDELDNFCTSNRGVIRQIGAIGSRKRTKKTSKYIAEPRKKLFIGGSSGACAYYAIINALRELKGEDLAKHFLDNVPIFTGRDLIDLSKFVEHNLKPPKLNSEPGFALEHTYGSHEWKAFPVQEALNKVLCLQDGIYLVHLIGTKIANHVIVVNTSTRKVIDNMENWYLMLTYEVLEMGCGTEPVKYVEDVRKLVQKRAGRRKRKYSRRERAKKSKLPKTSR